MDHLLGQKGRVLLPFPLTLDACEPKAIPYGKRRSHDSCYVDQRPCLSTRNFNKDEFFNIITL